MACFLLYYIPIIKRVGKGLIPFELQRGISSKNHCKSAYFMILLVWDNALEVIYNQNHTNTKENLIRMQVNQLKFTKAVLRS